MPVLSYTLHLRISEAVVCKFSVWYIYTLRLIYFRFKNVMFEIKSADEVGVFEVSAKFMGVAMEKVELVFQV